MHPYLIGEGEARSVLDSVRAARQLDGVAMAPQTVVWGHSQGGTRGALDRADRPELRTGCPLSGVAALVPASDLPALAESLPRLRVGPLFAAYLLAAYSRTYPDVAMSDVIRPTAVRVVEGYAQRCLAEPRILVSAASTLLAGSQVFRSTRYRGGFVARLRENTPYAPITAPVLLGQGVADTLIGPDLQRDYVHRRCTQAGGTLTYRSYPGRDHLSLVAEDSPLIPDLVGWTAERIAGNPPGSGCGTDP